MTYWYKDFIYVGTISDFQYGFAKVPVKPGKYVVKDFYNGYILTRAKYQPVFEDCVQIINTRDETGLSGTYHCGEIQDSKLMRVYNNYIFPFLKELRKNELKIKIAKKINEKTAYRRDYDAPKETNTNLFMRAEAAFNKLKVNELHSLHDTPAIFYLRHLPERLDEVTVDYGPRKGKQWGEGKRRVGVVRKGTKSIGLVVVTDDLHRMMGDQAGVGLLAYNKMQLMVNSAEDLMKIEQPLRGVDALGNFDGPHTSINDFDDCMVHQPNSYHVVFRGEPYQHVVPGLQRVNRR